jgi:hypothetical protein
MRGDEQRVVSAFANWLTSQGWHVTTEVDFVDVHAERDGQRLYGEAKGRTAATGLDVDTLYGQLLRRMPEEGDGVRDAVIVPSEAVTAALRVPEWVRRRLRIDVFEVTEGNDVHEVDRRDAL